MIPGPNYIYQCPQCENLISCESIASGNTFGSRQYSDGKRVAPYLPDYPVITKCKKCNTIFWINKLKEVGTFNRRTADVPEWEQAEAAEFLSITDYFTALETGVAENTDEEIYLRQDILWAFNDRYREGDVSRQGETDVRFTANNAALMQLLDPALEEHRILMAELYRYEGRFDDCMKMLSEIENIHLNWLIDAFVTECEKGNTMVFEMV